jgi:hypothetical protein
MAVRNALFLIPVALLLVPAAAFAQTPAPAAPADVEQALRSRVTEFFQDFVDGKFRQAINLVADDTQDKYFSSPKAEITAFNIDRIDFTSDFSKANVHLTVKQVWKLKAEGFMQDQIVDSPMATDWKIENGKWAFYEDVHPNGWLTPMGPSADLRKPDSGPAIPPKLDQNTLAAEAARLLIQTKVDKDRVNLSSVKRGSEKVVFHNGAQGPVNVSLVGLPNVLAGFTAKLDKQIVNGGEDAIVEISYDPPAGLENPPRSFTIAVDVTPFNKQYPVEINFGTLPQ